MCLVILDPDNIEKQLKRFYKNYFLSKTVFNTYSIKINPDYQLNFLLQFRLSVKHDNSTYCLTIINLTLKKCIYTVCFTI